MCLIILFSIKIHLKIEKANIKLLNEAKKQWSTLESKYAKKRKDSF